MARVNGNEIKAGFILEHDGGLWAAVKVNHVKPGKGGAFAQVELKNLRDGRKLNERFRSEDKVEQVELENKDQQFLYETDGRLVFMPPRPEMASKPPTPQMKYSSPMQMVRGSRR